MVDHNELLPEGRELGGFRIQEAIGCGNMGIVYRAIQVNLNRPVALKVLFRTVAKDHDFVQSFFREAQAAAAFTHRHIVQAFDVGQSPDGIYYFGMELIEGGDVLQQLNIIGKYDPLEALDKMIGVADGLDYGSKLRKLTHGDIKPANIMVTKAGTLKLADLGLARMGGEIQHESDSLMLTPLYAAPEMINGSWSVGDPRSDMYSFGATLYHMMSGSPPFCADDYEEIIQMQLTNQQTALKDGLENFPVNVSRLVDRFLKKNPDDRFSNWGEAKSAMEVALKDPYNKKKKKIIYRQKKNHKGYKNTDPGSVPGPCKKRQKVLAIGILSLMLVAVIVVLSYFYESMETEETGKEDYLELTKSFEGKKPEVVIQLIEEFIKNYGITPTQAEVDLAQYTARLKNRSLFSVNDLSYQATKIADLEKLYHEQSSFGTESSPFNGHLIEEDLNTHLDNNGLIFHLPLNNTISNHANFSTGREALVNNGKIVHTAAMANKGVEFSGQSIDYGDVPALRLSPQHDFTMSFWIRPRVTDSPILGKYPPVDGATSWAYLLSIVDGKFQVDLCENAGTNKLTVKTTKDLLQSNWNHLVFKYEAQKPLIYMNGLKVELETFSSSLRKDFSSTGAFIVGFPQLDAILDDLRVWSRALTDKELEELNSFRAITELEKITGRYQEIKNKIDDRYFRLDHPRYRYYQEFLANLKAVPRRWAQLTEVIVRQLKTIARDVPAKRERLLIVSKHIGEAKERFDFILKNSVNSLAGKKIPLGACAGYEFFTFKNGVIRLKETSAGSKIIRSYNIRNSDSTDAINGVIALMLQEGLFEDDSPKIFIYAMIMGHDVNFNNLLNSGNFPEVIKGLKRDLDKK